MANAVVRRRRIDAMCKFLMERHPVAPLGYRVPDRSGRKP